MRENKKERAGKFQVKGNSEINKLANEKKG